MAHASPPCQVRPQRLGRSDWHAQLEALVRAHEPHRVRQVGELLRTFAGMERELLQCYRHHYTGAGGFRVASAPRLPSGAAASTRPPSAGVFSLPAAAIATFLREKLRARRSAQLAGACEHPAAAAAGAKGDDVRSPELLVLPATRRRREDAVQPLPSLNLTPRGR